MSVDERDDGRSGPFPLVRPSSRAMFRESRRLPDHSLFDWLHGYVYGRWPYLYIGVGTGEHRLSRLLGPAARWLLRVFGRDSDDERDEEGATFADGYHGKAVPLAQAEQLVMVNEDIRLLDLEQVIPYPRARDIVLKNPDHIVALDCPCRAVRSDPCLPLDVCLIIGEPFAGFVVEHHPRRSRWIEPEEAVEILGAEDGRGHVHHAFFKEGMLDRFYAICNCCSCCCGAMQAHQTGVPMLASSGYVSRVEDELCVGCGVCVDTCPFEALSLRDGVALVDSTACMGCGVCVGSCETEALALTREASKGVPLDIRELTASLSG